MKSLRFCSCLLFALLIMPVALAENIAELKINRITTPIETGGLLDFSFTAANMEGPSCSAEIQYWFDNDGMRALQGNDTIVLETGTEKTESHSLLIPSELNGIRDFYLQMQCNGAVVLASRVIEIRPPPTALPQFTSFDISEGSEDSPLEFSYSLKPSNGKPIEVLVKEMVIGPNGIAWESSQSILLEEPSSFKRMGQKLLPGDYSLIVEASRDTQTARVSRNFTVKPAQGWLFQAAFALALLASFASLYFLATRAFAARRTGLKRHAPVQENFAAPLLSDSAPLCVVESESEGTPDQKGVATTIESDGFPALYKTLSGATLDGGGSPALSNRGNGSAIVDGRFNAGLPGSQADGNRISGYDSDRLLEVATRTPVSQLIKAYLLHRKDGGVGCETAVLATVTNNSNSDWERVIVLARLPAFMENDTAEVGSDSGAKVVKGNGFLLFAIPRIGAMQSAKLAYIATKLVSESEAKEVPLPAVLSYQGGQETRMQKIKLEKTATAAKKSKKTRLSAG